MKNLAAPGSLIQELAGKSCTANGLWRSDAMQVNCFSHSIKPREAPSYSHQIILEITFTVAVGQPYRWAAVRTLAEPQPLVQAIPLSASLQELRLYCIAQRRRGTPRCNATSRCCSDIVSGNFSKASTSDVSVTSPWLLDGIGLNSARIGHVFAHQSVAAAPGAMTQEIRLLLWRGCDSPGSSQV